MRRRVYALAVLVGIALIVWGLTGYWGGALTPSVAPFGGRPGAVKVSSDGLPPGEVAVTTSGGPLPIVFPAGANVDARSDGAVLTGAGRYVVGLGVDRTLAREGDSLVLRDPLSAPGGRGPGSSAPPDKPRAYRAPGAIIARFEPLPGSTLQRDHSDAFVVLGTGVRVISLSADPQPPLHRAAGGLAGQAVAAYAPGDPLRAALRPLVSAQGVRTVRVVAAWDAALPANCAPGPAAPGQMFLTDNCHGLDRYLSLAARAVPGAELDVTLGAGPSDPLPSPQQYDQGLRALIARYPQVHVWGAWNEPDNRPLVDPGLAVAYWTTASSDVSALCRGCVAPAGEFANPSTPRDGHAAYARAYVAALDALVRQDRANRPAVWSYHAYNDVTYPDGLDGEGPLAETRTMAALVGAQWGWPRLWMTEGAAALRNGGRDTPLDGDPGAIAAAVGRWEALATEPRIDRVLYYQLANGDRGSFDSSLFDPAAKPRTAYCALLGRPIARCDGSDQPGPRR